MQQVWYSPAYTPYSCSWATSLTDDSVQAALDSDRPAQKRWQRLLHLVASSAGAVNCVCLAGCFHGRPVLLRVSHVNTLRLCLVAYCWGLLIVCRRHIRCVWLSISCCCSSRLLCCWMALCTRICAAALCSDVIRAGFRGGLFAARRGVRGFLGGALLVRHAQLADVELAQLPVLRDHRHCSAVPHHLHQFTNGDVRLRVLIWS